MGLAVVVGGLAVEVGLGKGVERNCCWMQQNPRGLGFQFVLGGAVSLFLSLSFVPSGTLLIVCRGLSPILLVGVMSSMGSVRILSRMYVLTHAMTVCRWHPGLGVGSGLRWQNGIYLQQNHVPKTAGLGPTRL